MIEKHSYFMERMRFNQLYDEVFTEQGGDAFFEFINFVESRNPKVIVEIGVKNGGTLNFWRNIVPKDGLVIGIDSQNAVTWNIDSGQKVIVIEGDSLYVKTYREFMALISHRKIDLLFIDGGHKYSEAKSDFYTFGWHVRKGGLIAMHDIDLNSEGDEIGATKHFWIELKERAGPFWNVVFETHQHTGTGAVERR